MCAWTGRRRGGREGPALSVALFLSCPHAPLLAGRLIASRRTQLIQLPSPSLPPSLPPIDVHVKQKKATFNIECHLTVNEKNSKNELQFVLQSCSCPGGHT